jgi:hypothetical protein
LGEAEIEDRPNALADVNIVWFLLRMFPTDIMTAEEDSTSQHVPTWNAFFELYSGKEAPKTKIGYGPMYPQTPTNPDVVKTSLDYFVSLNLKLGQSKTVITCDQAIYDIIKGLVRKDPVRYTATWRISHRSELPGVDWIPDERKWHRGGARSC